jgi:hypothetical protein
MFLLVHSLNFCRFSFADTSRTSDKNHTPTPQLVEDPRNIKLKSLKAHINMLRASSALLQNMERQLRLAHLQLDETQRSVRIMSYLSQEEANPNESVAKDALNFFPPGQTELLAALNRAKFNGNYFADRYLPTKDQTPKLNQEATAHAAQSPAKPVRRPYVWDDKSDNAVKSALSTYFLREDSIRMENDLDAILAAQSETRDLDAALVRADPYSRVAAPRTSRKKSSLSDSAATSFKKKQSQEYRVAWDEIATISGLQTQRRKPAPIEIEQRFMTKLRPSFVEGWSTQESASLFKLVEKEDREVSWPEIAQQHNLKQKPAHPFRSPLECGRRYWQSKEEKRTKARQNWNADMDMRIACAAKAYYTSPSDEDGKTLPSARTRGRRPINGISWKDLKHVLPGKTDRQCLQRYQKVLQLGVPKTDEINPKKKKGRAGTKQQNQKKRKARHSDKDDYSDAPSAKKPKGG